MALSMLALTAAPAKAEKLESRGYYATTITWSGARVGTIAGPDTVYSDEIRIAGFPYSTFGYILTNATADTLDKMIIEGTIDIRNKPTDALRFSVIEDANGKTTYSDLAGEVIGNTTKLKSVALPPVLYIRLKAYVSKTDTFNIETPLLLAP